MKKAERERLKHNEAADVLGTMSLYVATHGRALLLGAVALVVLIAGVLGYMAWRERTEERASVMLAEAIETANQPVREAGDDDPIGAASAGEFASETARTAAVIERLLATAEAYPSTDAGVQARYYAASLLAEAGRLDEAASAFEAVIQQAGRALTGRMARLGLASVQVRAGNHEPAIQTLQQLATGGSELPVDGVLMHLATAYAAAGRSSEAIETWRRIVNEFPQSPYANDARQQADTHQVSIHKAS